MKMFNPVLLFSLLFLIFTLSACSSMDETSAATRLCKDPDQTTPSPVVVQGCTRNTDCQVCGRGWTCWRSDGNCHNHAVGTPFDAMTEEELEEMEP